MTEYNMRIFGKNLEVTDEIKQYIEKKVSKFDRYIHKISSIEFTLKKEKYMYTVSTVIHTFNKKILKLSSADKSLRSAIDVAIDKIKEVLIKQKEKIEKPKKRHTVEVQQKYDFFEYTKNSLVLEKLTEKQAIEEIRRRNQDTLIFYNKDTDKISVLKKTSDGIILSDLIVEWERSKNHENYGHTW